MPEPLFHIVTLGCRINQYESQSLRESWLARGLCETHDPALADVLLFNSCAVTAKAVSELRAAVRKLSRDNPRARLVITGCAAQVQAEALAEAFPEARIVPQERKAELLERLPVAVGHTNRDDKHPGGTVTSATPKAAPDRAPGAAGSITTRLMPDAAADATAAPPNAAGSSNPAAASEATPCLGPDTAGSTTPGATTRLMPGAATDAAPGATSALAPNFAQSAASAAAPDAARSTGPGPAPDSAPRTFPPFSVRGFTRARPVVKVQDGCSQRCTYCIVPHTRGGPVSRDIAAATAEVGRLFEAGWREVVLSGINLRQYGADLTPPCDFWDLLCAMDAALAPRWAGRARLRLSSLDPAQLNSKALDTLGAARLVCPHLHLSLQSLAPAVLRRMGRGHYGPEQVAERVAALSAIWPVFGLGADILTGFPGETEADYRITLSSCAMLPLSYAHVFPYSIRPGTPAAGYPDQVPRQEKKFRAAGLRALVNDKRNAFARRVAALPEVSVILEYADPRHGMSQYYAECRFAEAVPGTGPRDLVRARPTAARGGIVAVEPARPPVPEPVDTAGKTA